MIEYKGCIGEVVSDDEAEVLHARVINSGPYPIANAEVADGEGIRREFRISIDVYPQGCAEPGIEPVAPVNLPTPAETSG
jgi:predicted HicB family RNase H-like nuclease